MVIDVWVYLEEYVTHELRCDGVVDVLGDVHRSEGSLIALLPELDVVAVEGSSDDVLEMLVEFRLLEFSDPFEGADPPPGGQHNIDDSRIVTIDFGVSKAGIDSKLHLRVWLCDGDQKECA